MPQRFLRPGITNSDRFNAVNWQQQSLFIRIITLVDDFGRFDGRPAVLFGHCYAVWNDKHKSRQVAMNLQQLAHNLQQLAANGLIELYADPQTGKQVLQVAQWQERIRAGSKEKWPPKPAEPDSSIATRSNPQQPAAIRSVPLPPSSPPPPSPSPSSPPTVPQGGTYALGFEEAKKFLHAVFRRKERQWSHEEMELLSKAVPIAVEDARLIKLWFELPGDHEVFAQKKEGESTRRKQELTTFLRDYNGELDKIHRFAPLFDSATRNGATAAKKEPAKWREFFAWKYSHESEWQTPEKWDDLARVQKEEYARDFAQFQEATK